MLEALSIFGRRAINDQPLIIFGDGTQQRSFTSVKDIAAINMLVASSDKTKGEVFNCASGIKVTILELAQKVLSALDKKHLEIRYEEWTPGDIKVFDVENEKIRRLGIEFNTNFDDGLADTLKWLVEYFEKQGAEKC